MFERIVAEGKELKIDKKKLSKYRFQMTGILEEFDSSSQPRSIKPLE